MDVPWLPGSSDRRSVDFAMSKAGCEGASQLNVESFEIVRIGERLLLCSLRSGLQRGRLRPQYTKGLEEKMELVEDWFKRQTAIATP
ncbi:hypothetical protein PABG_11246 [Paracoccidioides brasiliensis Pb03]|nr:hypothetical protein PABG_11246 [Paracoccidioides brasiliensis Pb03]